MRIPLPSKPGRNFLLLSFARRFAAAALRLSGAEMPRFGLAAGVLSVAALGASVAHADDAADAAAAASSLPAWIATFATETHFYSWQSTRGYPTSGSTERGSGAEIYTPFAFQVSGHPNENFKVEFLIRGGWVDAWQSTPGLSGQVSTVTDTVTSGTVTYLGLNGLQPFVSLNTNIPTGQSALYGAAAHARMDPDLVGLATFGEGFNVGPTIGVNIPFTSNFMATLGVGYTWHGQFVQESTQSLEPPMAQAPTTVKPGSDLTFTGALAYASGNVSTNLTGSISTSTTTDINGLAYFRAGTRYLLSGSVSYRWSPTLGVSTLKASAAHSDDNDVQFLGVSGLIEEPFDTNSNVFTVGIQHLFPAGKFAIGPSVSYLVRDHNGYNPDTLQFVPAKRNYTAGVLAQYSAGGHVTFNAELDHVWTNEDDNPAPGGSKESVFANSHLPATYIPAVSSVAWQGSIGMNVSF
ncbi:MAG: hypothetical protein AB7O60_19610 [Variibacter sp.]